MQSNTTRWPTACTIGWLMARVLLMLAASSSSAQELSLLATDPAGLRQAIAQYEEDSDYPAMILAAAELRDTATEPEDRIYALRSLGRGYALLGDRDRAVEALNKAVDQVEPDMSRKLLAELYRDTAGMLGELGRHEQALALVERGLGSLADVDAPDLQGALLVMKGSILGALGRLDEALSSIERAFDFSLSTSRQRIMRRNNLGMIHKWRGELEPAMREFEWVYERARAQGSEQLTVYALLELGDVARLLGDLDASRLHLEDALQRAEAAGEERWKLYAHGYLGELESAGGNEERAEFHRTAVERIQSALVDEAVENRARVLEISLEVLEREKRIESLQMERELQALELKRGRTLILLGAIAGVLLLIALWLAIQKNRVRASANRELDRLANTDVLTGLHNRRYLIGHLRQRAVHGSTNGALILIDLDRFKQINDEHGHEHGDAVLQEVAARIQAMMRLQDTVVRWGGEEFLAFLPDCNGESAVQVAERILRAVKEPPITYAAVQHAVTATIGVTETDDTLDFDAMFRRADEALYEGKKAGRNQVRLKTRGSISHR